MPDLSPDGVLAELQPIFQGALNSPKLTVTRTSNAPMTPGCPADLSATPSPTLGSGCRRLTIPSRYVQIYPPPDSMPTANEQS